MIYAICNQKGGVGKSTTAAALTAGATVRGREALAVDMDPQCNVSFTMAADLERAGVYDVITGKTDAGSATQHTGQGDVIPGSEGIVQMDTALTGDRRIYALRDALEPVRAKYDVIAIDCPPTLGTAMLNALAAADRVIIPTQADAFNLQGLAMLIQTIKSVQRDYNKNLHIAGVLFTRYNTRTVIARTYTDIIKQQAEKWRVPVLASTIREGVAVREAQTLRENLFLYAPRSNPARDYMSLLDELEILPDDTADKKQ